MTARLIVPLLGLFLLLGAPASALDPDGSSIERAIPADGVPREYAYIREHFPGWRVVRQALIRREGRAYDRLTIESPTGETRTVFFDITSFFGKMP